MKKPTKSTLLAAAAIAIGLSAAGIGVIHAANSTTQNPINNLVTALAQKFNLNQADVQQVVDQQISQQHQQMESQHHQQFADRLAADVKAGKLTQDQADKITAKMKELQAQREADKTTMQSKTQAERQAYMKQQMTALKQWATDNNIPAGYIPFGGTGFGPGGRGHGSGPGMGMGMMGHGPDGDGDAEDQPAASTTTTP